MKSKMQISDDSGFIGIANLSKYHSFVSANWDFEMLKKRIVDETNLNNILFWSTGREGNWNVIISTESQLLNSEFYRTEEALIGVTEGKLHLVNYETLCIGAQFKDTKLPEDHLANLYIEIENGLYLAEIGQLNNPDKTDKRSEVDFEIRLELIEEPGEYYPNNFQNIFWNIY